jgi:hypothetical protein
MKTGELVRLSQQELMDCSWAYGNNACDGGEDFRAYDYISQHGLATEEDYGSYLGQVTVFIMLAWIYWQILGSFIFFWKILINEYNYYLYTFLIT